MIIKGGSRGAQHGYTRWLGNHLTRADTNERVEVLELQSPHDEALSAKERLTETFRDWQMLCAGTRGKNGLYHVNIDPAEQYDMTPDQWCRCVEVLEKELGLEGQPRAVVLHEKHGRAHIHVVWSRTDIDTMTLRSDSHNYAAHERASLAMEQEFGHEHVPGKHAKRDRELQPEPPKAAFTHAEWQQAERSRIKPGEHWAAIAALRAGSDTGQAFQAALDDAGYVLARGDGRDFVVVDNTGKVHSLGRAVKMQATELRSFMADVERHSLPSAAEAAEQQKQQWIKREEPSPPDQAKTPDERREPDAAESPPDEEMELRARLAERYAKEREALLDQQRYTRNQHKTVDRAAIDRAAAKAHPRPAVEEIRTFERIWRDIRETFAPELRRSREEREAQRAAAMAAEQEKARKAEIAALEREQATRRRQLEVSQEAALSALEAKQTADLERRIDDAREAKRIVQEMELDRQRREERKQNRDGPEHGPPRAR